MAIDYKPEQNNYTNLTPFKTWLLYQINTWGVNNFPFLENDFDQLTNYGMMMKLMKAMNDTISNQNKVEEDMSNLYGAFTELQTYINNYFDNLDVQDEINNKLDEMTEDGTLEEIIDNYLNLKCEFIFPGKWGLNSSGNSNIVKVGGKVLLFDTNIATVYTYLKNMLGEENITHIDYLIISHFDPDHRGNINNLIDDGYIDENTIYYHPACLSEQYTQDVVNWYNTLEARCESLGITSIIPDENEIVNIGNNASMRFGNVDIEYSRTHYDKPNPASMIVEFKHNDYYALMMGDAVRQTEEHLIDIGFIKNEIGLYTIPHHAIEQKCSFPFYELINPKFAVAQTQMNIFNAGEPSYNQSSSLLFEKGCANYYSFNNEENIKFIEWNNSISCVRGIPTPHVGQTSNQFDIYCDSVSYNVNKQNGSEAYPFKDIIQALGMATEYKDKAIVIRLKDGTYGTTYNGDRTGVNLAQILNRKNYTHIVSESGNADNCILNDGLRITNCFKVRIDNITIKANSSFGKHVAEITASNVMFKNCKFIGNNQATLDGYGILAQNLSNVKTYYCTFQYLMSAYTAVSSSEITTSNDTINNVTYMARHEDGVKINIGKIDPSTDFQTITNLDNYSANRSILSKNYPYRITNDKMTGDINLPFGLNNIFKYLVIRYTCQFNGSASGIGFRIVPFKNENTLLISEFNAKANNTISNHTLVMKINNNVIQIVRNSCIEIANGGTLTYNSPSSSSDTSYGILITSIDFI